MKRSISLLLMPLLCALTATSCLHAKILLKGDDGAAATETFSFPIQEHATDALRSHFFVAAAPDQAGNSGTFAVAARSNSQPHPDVINSDSFAGITPENVTLNGMLQANPLFDKGVKHLSLISNAGTFKMNDQPLVVTNDLPADVYLIEYFINPNNVTMYSAENIFDATGTDTTSEIVGIEGTIGSAVTAAGAFAAVTPNGGGNFGAPGSGIALISLATNADGKLGFNQIDAGPGAPAGTEKRAAAFDNTSPLIKFAGGDTTTILNSVVDMHWDADLQRLYIALQVDTDGGSRGIVVGRVDSFGKMSFSAIAEPGTIFTGTNKIVGAQTAGASINKVRTMRTSTGLDYMIVLGNVTGVGDDARDVFALPLVNYFTTQSGRPSVGVGNQALHGTLARKDALPTEEYTTGNPSLLIRRTFKDAATQTADLPTTSDDAALVGCGQLPAGDITDISILRDTVYVSVGVPATDQKPGIFYSTALLDDTGKIKGWTQWQRAAGTIDNIFGFCLEPKIGNFTLMSGTAANTVRTAHYTEWARGNEIGLQEVADITASELPADSAGVQGLFDFPATTPGLNNVSMLVTTGYKKVVITELAQVVSSVVCPLMGNFTVNKKVFTDGAVTETLPGGNPPLCVSITGGVLDDIGAIEAAEFAGIINFQGPDLGLLFVGGVGGLAVLTDSGDDGFVNGLGHNFAGMTNDMSFKKVGNYHFVRKLIFDNDSLYVLTDTQLDRLDLTTTGFPATTVATISNPSVTGDPASLLDVIISGPFAALATSTGLFRVGNNNDISSAATAADVGWTQVPINEGLMPVMRLFALTKTGREQDLANDPGGNLYVTNAHKGLDDAQVNRFCVKLPIGEIDDTTMLPLPDIRVKGIPTSFFSFVSFREQFITDGTLMLHWRDRDVTLNPMLYNIPLSGNELAIPLSVDNANNIIRILRTSASGSWLVGSDTGLQINE